MQSWIFNIGDNWTNHPPYLQYCPPELQDTAKAEMANALDIPPPLGAPQPTAVTPDARVAGMMGAAVAPLLPNPAGGDAAAAAAAAAIAPVPDPSTTCIYSFLSRMGHFPHKFTYILLPPFRQKSHQTRC